MTADAVVNIFEEAGIKNPDFSAISDEFLEEVRGGEPKNLAIELLKKPLQDDIRARSRANVVQGRKLKEMLEDSVRRYRNQVIGVADILEELINLGKETAAADARGEALGLEPYELAFYDALAQNESAREVMGVPQLRELAIVLTDRIRKNVSIDWNLREGARAKIKVMVKRPLRQYGRPSDMEALATELALEQAAVFADFAVNS